MHCENANVALQDTAGPIMITGIRTGQYVGQCMSALLLRHGGLSHHVALCRAQIASATMQDQLRRAGQISSAMEARLHEEGRAAGHAQAQAQVKALQQARAEAQAAAQHQIQALLQERDDLQVSCFSLCFCNMPKSGCVTGSFTNFHLHPLSPVRYKMRL